MTDADARARRRRAEWTGGKATSFDELAEIDLEAWLAVPPSERLGMVFDMWFEQAGEEKHETAARLQRSIGGVRQRGS
jgi:hypothetical protein